MGSLAFIPGIRETLFPVAEIKDAVSVDEASYDVELKGINTPSTNLKNFYGKKVVFLNFWGTWCAPCREEWPTIEALYQNRKEEVEFVLIAMLDEEEDVRNYLNENHFTAPVYIAQSPIGEKILPKVYPTTFILSPKGQILKKETATRDWNDKEINEFLDHMMVK